MLNKEAFNQVGVYLGFMLVGSASGLAADKVGKLDALAGDLLTERGELAVSNGLKGVATVAFATATYLIVDLIRSDNATSRAPRPRHLERKRVYSYRRPHA
jgi:hypothetical protein